MKITNEDSAWTNSRQVKRWLFLVAGLFIMAFGVAFSIKAGLGTSPISSVPYVLSLAAPLTVGNITILMHCVFILMQILILRKKYEAIQLLQLPIAVIFGYLTDFAVWVLTPIQCEGYAMKWLVCLIGITLVAVGVSFEVVANVVTLAGEGLVLAICRVAPVKFGTMKVVFDVSLVLAACIFHSCIFTGFTESVRERLPRRFLWERYRGRSTSRSSVWGKRYSFRPDAKNPENEKQF